MTEDDLITAYTAVLWDLLPVLAVDDAVRALVARDYASAWWTERLTC